MINVLVPFRKKQAAVVQNVISSIYRRNYSSACGSRVSTGVRPGTEGIQVSSFTFYLLHTIFRKLNLHKTLYNNYNLKKVHYLIVHSDQSSQKLSRWSLSRGYQLAIC